MSGSKRKTRFRMIVWLLLPVSLALRSPRILAEERPAFIAPLAAAVAGNNQFAWELYRKIGAAPENQGANIFFSPHSLSTALAMTYAGSHANTALQMARVLYFPPDQAALHRAFASLNARIARTDGQAYQLKMANALWGQRDYHFEADFLKLIAHYQGGFQTVDYIHEPQESLAAINQWAARETAGKIDDLLRPEDITSLTRLILANAVYFKGDWETPFKPEETRNAPFSIAPGRTVEVPLMHLKAVFRYARSAEAQVLELPYAGKDLAMLVILPEGDLGRLEAGMTRQRVEDWQRLLAAQNLQVHLPRFKFSARYYLDRILPEMGMSDAFSRDRADFSGMTGDRDLYIKHLIHQAAIDLNEQGGEATAATAVVMEGKNMIPTFRADRPFIFAIVHQPTGSLLFLGRLADPCRT